MDLLAKLAFALYTLIIVTGAIMAVASGTLVRALLGLIGVMIGVAGMYLLLAAPFVAFMQILIYVGGVSVLIFFAVMLTRAAPNGDESSPGPRGRGLYALFALVVPAVLLSCVIVKHPASAISRPVEVGAVRLGEGMLGPYVLPFELISLLLFIAMAGAVLVAWRKWGRK